MNQRQFWSASVLLLAAALAACKPGESVAQALALGRSEARAVQAERQWSEHRVATPDGELFYTRLGQGPVLVVIPGGPGGSGHHLRHAFAPLARDFSVLIVDNIGRGRSARLADPSRYTLERDAEDIERLRVFLGQKTIAVYGHSYGGLVAQQFAISHPERLNHLVLGNTLHGAASWQSQIDGFKVWLKLHEPERWEQLLALRAQGALTASAEAQALVAPAFAPLYWADRVQPHAKAPASADPRDAFNPEVYAAMLGPDAEWQIGGSLRKVELLPRLSVVKAPTLVLTGRYDPVAPPLLARQIGAALKAAPSEQQIFEHSGHRPFIEEPEAWRQRVTTFLQH
ncbi:alpha/beta hydrolase [Paucibacter sp. APW11]|uniref:Alpha/beta hydrolase n=2 Tax=Roseateles aquae TaxID=3077235 RepID=A0ABU3P775_9BURK|nr:alpha/beta hydrolase [Paucibacter sp. APW11]